MTEGQAAKGRGEKRLRDGGTVLCVRPGRFRRTLSRTCGSSAKSIVVVPRKRTEKINVSLVPTFYYSDIFINPRYPFELLI